MPPYFDFDFDLIANEVLCIYEHLHKYVINDLANIVMSYCRVNRVIILLDDCIVPQLNLSTLNIDTLYLKHTKHINNNGKQSGTIL